MPSSTQYTTTELMRLAADAASAVQATRATMASRAVDLRAVVEQIPGLEEAVAGKLGTLSLDKTKVGGVSSCASYAPESHTLPAGGSWLVFYCTDFPYGSDRAAGSYVTISPGGTKITGINAWWTLNIRIS